ncbi:hypothetical protein DSECCO2_337140 [anaerobic digester metagenome]
MYRLTGKKGKEKAEVTCTVDDFTAEYTKLMREGYRVSVETIGMDLVKSKNQSFGVDNE